MRRIQKHGWMMLLVSVLLLLLFAAAAQAEGGQVSGFIWQEKTVDGEITSGEGGFAKARVVLEGTGEDGRAVMVASAVTTKAGDFIFTDVPAGRYRLYIELPSDCRFTIHGGASSALPAQGNISYTPYFDVEDGESVVRNIGVSKSYATITVIAFEDSNANGGRLDSEPLIRNARVEILYEYEGETLVVAHGVTDRQGQVIFKELSPGTYTARATLPESFVVGPVGQKLSIFYNCFLPDETNGGTTLPFTVAVKDNQGLAVGAVRTGSLTGRAWYDANYNGRWDDDENGLTDAVITLYSSALSLSRETRADSSGDYAFLGLQPGEYQLLFTLPEGMVFTYPGSSLISDISSQGSLNVSVQVDVTTSLGAVGAMPAASMALSLYQDLNLNGEWDEDEPGLPGVTVSAAQNGKTVATAVSSELGSARFTALRGGETALTASLPEGYLFFADEENLFGITAAQTKAEAAVTLDGNEPEAFFSAAVTVPASISGLLFEDPDNTGTYLESNPRLSGFTVQACKDGETPVAEAVTGERGEYTLSPLLPGEYAVRFLLDDVYVASPYAADDAEENNHLKFQDPGSAQTSLITLAPGEEITSVNGSVFRAGVVDGYVRLRESADAEVSGGLAGVTVTLLSPSGAPVSAHSYGVTDENGYFFIKGVLPGTYTLLYSMPDNGAFIVPDISSLEYETEPVTATSGSEIHMPDLAGVYTSSLSGRVLSAEGTPVSARFTLTAQDESSDYEARAKEDGSYYFSGLRPGTYTLDITLPEGLVFASLPASPIPAAADSAQSVEITFAMRQDIADADICAAAPVAVSGIVYYDENLSAEQDEEEYGAEGRTLALIGPSGLAYSAETDENGRFTFGRLAPGEYILRPELDENEVLVGEDFSRDEESGAWQTVWEVWEDTDVTIPLMQYATVEGTVWCLDGTENGVSGIPVTLNTAEGDFIAAVETDDHGAFAFTGLMPGDYSLDAELTEGYLFAREQDAGERDSMILSLPDGALQYIPFFVPMGDEISGLDIGIGAMGRIGDRAWLDENGNGMQDTGEPSVPGVQIELYQHGQWIASTVTDAYGRYQLSNLYPGEYEMRVTMPAELKATKYQSDFPLVGSILPESNDLTLTVNGVVVPSGSQNLHCDLGFQLRKKGVYPAEMSVVPTKNWTPYSDR